MYPFEYRNMDTGNTGDYHAPSVRPIWVFRFTDVSHPYSSPPVHVRYLYLFATYTLSLCFIFATRHNNSHPGSGKDIEIILKLNGGDMAHLYILSACYSQMNNIP